MKAIDFPQANVGVAKDQPQFATLYAYTEFNQAKDPVTQEIRILPWEMTVCFELTDEEIQEFIRTRKLWLTQCVFGHLFHPIRMTTLSPFIDPHFDLPPKMDENRVSSEVWDQSHYYGSIESEFMDKTKYRSGPCANCGLDHQYHIYSTRQCPPKQ